MRKLLAGVVTGVILGSAVAAMAGSSRGQFESLSSYLSKPHTFQLGYTAGVWDTLQYVEGRGDVVTQEVISKTLNCMDHRTLGETADWLERRLRADNSSGNNGTVDSLIVYDEHPCTLTPSEPSTSGSTLGSTDTSGR